MNITKEIILKIQLIGNDLENLKSALHTVIDAESSSKSSILKKEQIAIIETILKTIK